jgi:hypothetical protein
MIAKQRNEWAPAVDIGLVLVVVVVEAVVVTVAADFAVEIDDAAAAAVIDVVVVVVVAGLCVVVVVVVVGVADARVSFDGLSSSVTVALASGVFSPYIKAHQY